MDVSGFNNIKKLSYNWRDFRDLQARTRDTIVVVPGFNAVDSYFFNSSDVRGIIKKDFMPGLDSIIKSEPAYEFSFTIGNFTAGLEELRPRVEDNLWKKAHLFLDEAVSNAAMHSGKKDCFIDASVHSDNSVMISIKDFAGGLSRDSVERSFISLCSYYNNGNKDHVSTSSINLKIGGNGLRLLFHYATFIKFNVIPSELTQIIGIFIPGLDFNGYVFEDRREEILDVGFFGKGWPNKHS